MQNVKTKKQTAASDLGPPFCQRSCYTGQTLPVGIIGIKNDFPFINILKVPRELLKTEGETRGFQHLPRDLANVSE